MFGQEAKLEVGDPKILVCHCWAKLRAVETSGSLFDVRGGLLLGSGQLNKVHPSLTNVSV